MKSNSTIPTWHAKYVDGTVRSYQVKFDSFDNFVLVRLYRNEADKFGVTPRELDVLAGLVDDLSDEEIASKLNIENVTVRRHMQNLRDKLGVSGRAKLAVEAFRLGVLD